MKKYLGLLEPAQEKGKYICPVCNGHNFSVNNTTGAYNCWNGCSTQSLREAVLAMLPETEEEERTEKAPRKHEKTEYLYNDRNNNPLIKVVKVVPGFDGKDKSIYQQHWNGTNWAKGYGSVKTPDIPLYRYAEIMEAIERGEPIVLCEGESTADAFWDKGIPATTTIGGTGKTVKKRTETVDKQPVTHFERNLKTFESIKPALADLSQAEVILAPDQDKPGCLHMEMMAELLNVKGWLYAFPDSFQWTRLKDKGGCDLVDWVHDYPKLTKQDILAHVTPNPTHSSPSTPQPEKLEPPPISIPQKRLLPGVVAKQLIEKYPHLRYIKDSQTWMKYEAELTGAWGEISTEEVEQLAMMYLEEIGQEELRSVSYVSEIVKFTQRHRKVFRRTWNEADNSRYLPFTNGVLNLKTGEFLGHDPKYHLTWTLPRPHHPMANQWETIDAWLDFATQGKRGLRSILECFASAVLKGRCDLQKFLHLVGVGGSGKGTYMRLITSLIGANNVVTSNLEQFCMNRFETARVYRKRLVLFSDERSKPRNISEFMKLTGQDMLRAEKKQKEAFDFTHDGMVILASEFPIFHGETGNGLKRRTIPLSMNARIEDKDRRDLQSDFEPELAAFTNHLLELPDEFVSETLRNVAETPDVELQYWQARMAEDSISEWLNEHLIYDPYGAETPLKELYQNYKEYCQESGSQAKSNKRFAGELLEVCHSIQWQVVKQTSKMGRVVKGLKVRLKGSYKDYPTYENQLEEKAKIKGDGLGDGLVTDFVTLESSPSIAVTDVTDFSNKIAGGKKSEGVESLDREELVAQDTLTAQKIRSDFETVRTELSAEWVECKARLKSVKEGAFKAKFDDSEAVEKHIQLLELLKRVMRNNGKIYNAYKLVFEVGEEVEFEGKKWKETGVIERVNFPYYTVKGSSGKMHYLSCFEIEKKQ